MRNYSLKLCIIFLFFISFCNLSFSQGYTSSSIIITDHNGNNNPVVTCDYSFNENHCITLSVIDYPKINKTTDYIVTQLTDFDPVGDFTEGTTIDVSKDDIWSKAIKLPFTFCLYEQSFDYFVVNDNGVVAFDPDLAEKKAPFNIAGSASSGKLAPNTIFGAYHDLITKCLDGKVCGKISWYTTGTAPFRKVIINFSDMTHVKCANLKSTFQIVLYESTNEIAVHIKNKPHSCVANSRALIAITGKADDNGSVEGIAPASRDDVVWEAQNESWKFSPQGEITPEIVWYNQDYEKIGDGKSIEVCPSESTTYKAKVIYNSCKLDSLSNSSIITFSYEYPQAKKITKNFCFDGISYIADFEELAKESIGNQTNVNTSFYLTEKDALKKVNPQTGLDSFYMNYRSQTFFLRVENSLNEDCFTVTSLSINLWKTPNLSDVSIEKCVVENQKISYDLKTLENSSLFESEFTATYFYTQQDAVNNQNAIANSILNLGPPTQEISIYARVSNKYYSDCGVKIITIKLKFMPKMDLPDKYFSKCGLFENEEKDLTIFEQEIGDYDYYYYTSLKDAEEKNDNFIPPAETKKYIVNTGTVIFVRVENYKTGYCPPIFRILFIKQNTGITNYYKNYCIDTDENSVNINLNDIFNEMSKKSSATVSGFTLEDGTSIIDPDNFVLTKNVTITVSFIENGCPFSKQIELNFRKKIEKTSSYPVCDVGNDGVEKFYLPSLNEMIGKGYSKPVITYYTSYEDLKNNNNPIEEITITGDTNVYIKVQSAFNCDFIYIVKLYLINYVFAETNNLTVNICDNNLDNKEIVNLKSYESSLLSVSTEGHTFRYYTSYDNAFKNIQAITEPEDYKLENFPVTIYVKISDSSTCFSIVELKFVNINTLKADNFTLYVCDDDSDGYVDNIDLSEYPLNNMLDPSIDSSSIDISYHASESDANNDLKRMTEYEYTHIQTSAKRYIWIRFTDTTTNCYTVRSIEIKIPLPPKIYPYYQTICDTDLDGVYVVNLEELNSKVMDEDYSQYTFTHYTDPEGTQKIVDYKNFKITNFSKGDSITIYISVSQYSCSSPVEKAIILLTENKVPVNSEVPVIQSCDDDFDGFTTFDLTTKVNLLTDVSGATYSYYNTYDDARNELNPKDPKTYKNITINADTVYVRISAPNYCPNIGKLKLEVLPVPVSPLLLEYKICPDETLVLDAYTGNDSDTYEWNTTDIITGVNNNSSITIDKPGQYWVTITGANGCSYTYYANVTEYERITVKQVIAGKDYITVIAEGLQPLEYSLDKISWQDSNTFTNLEPAIYNIYIRSKNIPCKPTVVQGIIFKIPNTITPNDDGYNDVWRMCGLHLFKGVNSDIKIFNRYGKVVFEEASNTCFIWNGYYLGRPLPTASYWYVINIPDGRKFTGWIMLRNYNEDSL